jgi:hypothetical protein
VFAADLLDRHAGLGLTQKANDLLFAEFACSHVHHSPGGWTSWKFGWYGLWGAGQRLSYFNIGEVPQIESEAAIAPFIATKTQPKAAST